MLIGVPKEIKTHEYRVGLITSSVRELVHHGHEVIVQANAGRAIGLDDEHYVTSGARIVDTAEEIFAVADMVVKVKEPQPNECRMLREGQLLFTYLHLAPDPGQTELLMGAGCVAIAYETVTDDRGGLPLLAPMSEVAGRMSIQAGAHCLEMEQGGRGMLLGGLPGVPPEHVVVVGSGNVGKNAVRAAVGAGARVTVLSIDEDQRRELEELYSGRVETVLSSPQAVARTVAGGPAGGRGAGHGSPGARDREP